MRANLEPGNRVGMLTVVSADERDIGERGERCKLVTMYRLRCECGKELRIRAGAWKKFIVDCGCGIGASYIPTPFVVTLPMGLKQAIARAAMDCDRSVSGLVVELLESVFGWRGNENTD
jgi:hypothetical protein